MILIVSFGYVLFLLVLWRVEWVRTAKAGPDLLQLFLMVFALYLIIPGALLTAMIWLFGSNQSTGVKFFDRVLDHVGAVESGLVMLMSVLFVGSLYVTWRGLYSVVGLNRSYVPKVSIEVSRWRWIFLMLLGLAGMWVLLEALGGGLTGYRNLMFFRAGSDDIERTFATANLFSQAQTFLILSVLGVLLFWRRRARLGFLFAIFCVIVFGLMCVSRRSFAIATLLVYFTLILANKRFYFFRFVVPAILVFMPVIMFGKEFISYFAMDSDVVFDLADRGVATGLAGVRRALSDIGISTVNSWATLLYLDIPFRFGVDHVLSVARRFPEGFLELDIDFPERIVEISTKAFVGYPDQDIPPGLIGQMWLDFGVFGPVIWGIAFGIQIAILQMVYNRVAKTIEAIALFVIVLFVVAMPLNTGSFDFTFSVDIILLFIFMVFITIRKRVGIEERS